MPLPCALRRHHCHCDECDSPVHLGHDVRSVPEIIHGSAIWLDKGSTASFVGCLVQDLTTNFLYANEGHVRATTRQSHRAAPICHHGANGTKWTHSARATMQTPILALVITSSDTAVGVR